MEPATAVSIVKDLFAFRDLTKDPVEIATELRLFGFTLTDLKADPDLFLELGLSRSIRRACTALEIPVTPHQSLTLAKHMTVGKERYRNGVPLSDHERSIAMRLRRTYFQACCREKGIPFAEEHERDCERMVSFGEHGLTVGHKIGEASGL